MDFIYHHHMAPGVAESCGYFQPKEGYQKLYPKVLSVPENHIGKRILYYPGSFGTFHDGHVSVVKRALEQYPNSLIVIAPSNSDYTVEKYGAWSEYASNKHRYDAIVRALEGAGVTDYFIDIDPMLNHRCDQNFTMQVQAFLFTLGRSILTEELPPVIITGKDRKDFLNLNEHTRFLEAAWFDDTTGASTSALPNRQREKKHLILRFTKLAHYRLFVEYFSDQYKQIYSAHIPMEIERAREFAEKVKATHTCCKDYSGFLPYIRVNRFFQNPLENSVVLDRWEVPEGAVVLDSDIYSGSTRRYVESKGASLVAPLNLEPWQTVVELLDVEDFLKPEFCYPFVDISSRCSMQAFDYEFHKKYNSFREALRHV